MFKLITFEGMSGSGKTRNHQKLCDCLNIKIIDADRPLADVFSDVKCIADGGLQ